MKRLQFVTLCLLVVLLPFSAEAATHRKKHHVAPVAPSVSNEQPDLISLGAGWFDVIKNKPRAQTLDFRIEHRWGVSLLPLVHNYFSSWNSWFQIHPMAGVEVSTRGQFYGYGGLVLDFLLGKHVVLSPNVVVGYYDRGNGKYLGSFVEFRSTVELGWRFENEMRLTGYFGHISNAGLTSHNPGAETAGLYLHVPTDMIFGR